MFIVQDYMKNGKIYNGNTYKFGITVNGIDLIVKYPKGNDMSVYCEYIASNLIRNIDVRCHKVELGVHNGVLVNIIYDFTSGTNLTLHSFKGIKQSSEDTDIGSKEYTYSDVLYLIDKNLKMSNEDKLDAKIQFWNMFICDAIIGNRDRHWGNWGYLCNSKEYRFAPLYDNGAGLYPNVNNVIKGYIDYKSRKQFLYERVFIFPASLFKIKKKDRSYRSNYEKMFSDLRINKIFSQQVKLFRSKISYKNIFNIMIGIVKELSIDNWYKRFYIEIVTLRYMCIVLRKDFEKSFDEIEYMLRGVGL